MATDNKKSAVCFLVINQIEALPTLAINSVLNTSNKEVIVGYISKNDIQDLPKNSRVTFLDLSLEAQELGISSGNHKYQTFDQDTFFSLVRLKWVMLSKLLMEGHYSYLIYNDVDVYWLQDPSSLIEESFESMDKVEILIQNFTINPARPNLCMGFVAFRNSEESLEIVRRCAELHNQMLKKNSRTGDDDVISSYYLENSFPPSIVQLPQGLFPVGNFANLFSKKNLFPGLTPYKPYIFHANFVVGVRKKIQLSRLVLWNFSGSTNVKIIDILALRINILTRRTYLNARSFIRKYVRD